MHELIRISLQNWYLIDAIDIDVVGATALIGPTGAGKTSIQDAIQTAITGNNSRRVNLNASASGRSERSVRDYCLGYTADPDEGGTPLRDSCESVIALTFRDEETGEPISIGVALSARREDSREETLSRFIAPGYAYSVRDFARQDDQGRYLLPWAEAVRELRRLSPALDEHRHSAERFTAEYLAKMRRQGQQPNTRHFLRTFANAIAFRPIFDPTEFVRKYILEPDPLNVDRIRSSIATWRGIVATIEELEAKLRRLTRIEGQFRNWGRNLVQTVNDRWTAAAAETRRLAMEVVEAGTAVAGLREELAAQEAKRAELLADIKEIETELEQLNIRLQTTGVADKIRQYDSELKLANAELKALDGRIDRLVRAWRDAAQIAAVPVLRQYTPASFQAGLEAATSIAGILAGAAKPAAALKADAQRLEELHARVASLGGLDERFEAQRDAILPEIKALQADIEALEQNLARIGEGAAPLGRETTRLIAELERRGIPVTPLCDVVEIADESWQYAVEALLGRGREALIVPPDRVREAFEIMYQRRNEFYGCTLIKTNRGDHREPRIDPDSIASVVRSDNPHALAYIATRIGGFRMAETEAELERMDRAVLRNGKTTSGLGLNVHRDLPELIFGRRARTASAERLRRDIEEKRAKHAELTQTARLLASAATGVKRAVDALREASSGPAALAQEASRLEARIARIIDAKDKVAIAADPELIEEIEVANTALHSARLELTEDVEPAIRRLDKALGAETEKLETRRAALRRAFAEKRQAYAALADQDYRHVLELDQDGGLPSINQLITRFRTDVFHHSRRDLRGHLAELRLARSKSAEDARKRAAEYERAAIRELTEYVSEWRLDSPLGDGTPVSWGYQWAVAERLRLEQNELRAYRERAVAAEAEMRQTFKEDLLTKLAAKFQGLDQQLDTLNRQLDRHRFTGQRYSFSKTVDSRYANLYRLATKVADNPEQGQTILALGADESGDEVTAEAMRELGALLEGDQDTSHFEDYRNYFTFELEMRSDDGSGPRTSMSKRAVKGSGGEAQAPFYVAIAASLASAYYPGPRGVKPQGMGLALFDEAFSKLDIQNTQALLRFYKALGLQLLIAAPEDKRATFTEVLDTIVMVNKSPDGRFVYIDTEHPRERARSELLAINPDHLGVEGFRKMLAASAAE